MVTASLLAAWLALAPTDLPGDPPGRAQAYRAAVQVEDPAQAADKLVAEALRQGGWFVLRTRDRLELRVPAARAQAFRDSLPRLGTLVEQDASSENLAPALADLDARLAAKRQALEQTLALLRNASDTSLFEIEASLRDLQREIDQAEGARRLIDDRLRYARLTLDFRFHERVAPLPTGRTRFAWVNALGLQNLLDDDDAPHVHGFKPPRGFGAATWGRGRALSPDGVIYRERKVDNDPKADLAFWSKTARARLEQGGYRVTGDSAFSVRGEPGRLLRLSAPLGERDYAYWVALSVRGGSLRVIETAGEAKAFRAREADIRAALAAK